MRWKTIDLKNQDEIAGRDAILHRIDSWWREFASKTKDVNDLFAGKSEWDLPDWMYRHLQGIHPALMWEYGPAVRGEGHRLVITPETQHHLLPLVETVLQRAPRVEGWEFYASRLAENLEMARRTVEGRTGVDFSTFKVKVARGEHNRIDLTYTSPAVANSDIHAARNAAFVATESLLGEELLNNWIGGIEVIAWPRAGGLLSFFGRNVKELPLFIELDRLRETVNALIGSIRDQLPERPHFDWIGEATWTLWQLEPEPADDYCDQLDLRVAKSANPPQWSAAHSPCLFKSERYSRCGETFCYVKIDGLEGLPEGGFTDKSDIEDALDDVLKPAKLGCHVGGGTGLRYSYIDLALTNVGKAIPRIRERLQAGMVPRRSWILFSDSDLAAEWIGIYDDSPPPPMAAME